MLILGSECLLVWIDATDFSTFRALKIILIENAIEILDVSDPMPASTLFYHYQVGHCREPTRTLFVAGSELVRVRVDPEPNNLVRSKCEMIIWFRPNDLVRSK